MTHTPATGPKIAIIGAGPAGLCLANILQRNSIPFTVFEGDKSQYERTQGGTLDLHPQFGQLALREAGLWDDFVKHARPEADVMKIVGKDGEIFWDGNTMVPQETTEDHKYDNRPEIDREKLKEILFAHLDLGNVQFGKHLQEMEADNVSGKYTLLFKDGGSETGFDLVIGAEGAWSKVRKVLTETMPHYSGISAVELWKDDVNNTNPWLSQYVGAGSCFYLDEGRTIQIQRLGDGSVRTYACLRKPETFLKDCGIDWTKPEEARRHYVNEFYADCNDDLKRVILESDSRLIPRPLYMLPVGFRWEHRSGVTLLGDAAHVMTPFAGVGVNAALADALDLARNIVQAVKTSQPLDTAIQAYEHSMFPRGEKFAQKTLNNMQGTHFRADGGKIFAKRFHDHYGTGN